MVQAVWNLVYVQGPAPSALFHSKEHRHASSEHWNRVKGLFGEGKKKCHTHTSKRKIIKDLTIKRTLDLEFWWHSSALSALDIKHCRSTPPKNNEMKDLEFITHWRPSWPQSWDQTSAKPSCEHRNMSSLQQFWYQQAPGARTIFVQLLTSA